MCEALLIGFYNFIIYDMKRLFYFFFAFMLFFVSSAVWAQNGGYEMADFRIAQEFSDIAQRGTVVDGNKRPCGLVVLKIDLADVKIEGGSIIKAERHEGDWWIWLADGAQGVTLRHSGPDMALECDFPRPVVSGRGYVMTVVNVGDEGDDTAYESEASEKEELMSDEVSLFKFIVGTGLSTMNGILGLYGEMGRRGDVWGAGVVAGYHPRVLGHPEMWSIGAKLYGWNLFAFSVNYGTLAYPEENGTSLLAGIDYLKGRFHCKLEFGCAFPNTSGGVQFAANGGVGIALVGATRR